MSDYLPNQIWMEIFVELPIKTILSCTCVCRSWKDLIRSQEFISKHLNFKHASEAHNLCLLVHSRYNPRQSVFTFYEENSRPMDILAVINSPFRLRKHLFQIVGTCNGLLCLCDNFRKCYDNVIVWNPLVGKSMYFPRPNITCNSLKSAHQFGFGYDSIENDYKVVSIVCRGINENLVEILKLSTSTWENISDRALGHFSFLTNGQVYMNGSLHWIGKVVTNNNIIAKIVLFDVHEERFHEMELPETLATIVPHYIKVGIYMGLLAIVLQDGVNFSIWTMSEYGNVDTWNKQICTNCSLIRWLSCGFTRNCGILNTWPNENLCIFHPVTPPFNWFNQYILSTGQSCSPLYATSYVETLVFIDKGLEFSDRATADALLAANRRTNSHNDA